MPRKVLVDLRPVVPDQGGLFEYRFQRLVNLFTAKGDVEVRLFF